MNRTLTLGQTEIEHRAPRPLLRVVYRTSSLILLYLKAAFTLELPFYSAAMFC